MSLLIYPLTYFIPELQT